MPQVSPLHFTGALHVACVNTCIIMQSSCRMVYRMYSYCFMNTTEYQGFIKNFLFKRGIAKQRISK